MNTQYPAKLLDQQHGMITADAYTTAWIALVPSIGDKSYPAWPQALTYIRQNQLDDGGWGESSVYYAHERTISTLAALRALLEWNNPNDKGRIDRGIEALHKYALDLASEPCQPVGFELLLPAFISELKNFDVRLPLKAWSRFDKRTAAKVALIGSLQLNYNRPRTWWFSLEMLPVTELARIDGLILNEHGSVATSPAATAAYLRALRLQGRDSRRAAYYLEHVLTIGGGGAGVIWPAEVFELVWVLDCYMRAGLEAKDPTVTPLVERLARCWNTPPLGLSLSQGFPVNDGDDTIVGYNLLRWAGLNPSEEPLQQFWNNGHFCGYPDERDPSVSVNVNALLTFRADPTNKQHREKAICITEWLYRQISKETPFHDKWHYSPLYTASRAVSALAGWDNELASRCLEFILERQDESGGWGWTGRPTLEETSHVVLGLAAASQAGLFRDSAPLRLAAQYLHQRGSCPSAERLWIGKTLYHPTGIVQATLYAAQIALANRGLIKLQRPGSYLLRLRHRSRSDNGALATRASSRMELSDLQYQGGL